MNLYSAEDRPLELQKQKETVFIEFQISVLKFQLAHSLGSEAVNEESKQGSPLPQNASCKFTGGWNYNEESSKSTPPPHNKQQGEELQGQCPVSSTKLQEKTPRVVRPAKNATRTFRRENRHP